MACLCAESDANLAGANDWVQHEAGGYTARFVPLVDGDETFFFVESCCFNKMYDTHHVFVPVQHADKTCSIYKVNVHAPDAVSVKVCSVTKKSDGEKKISPFGSALSDDGMLWLCCFSESLIMAIDLAAGKVACEVSVPAPNDICLSEDGSYAYAACGSYLGKLPLAAGKGTIWRVETSAPFNAQRIVRGAQGTMAGIAESDKKLYCAHLQRMSVYPTLTLRQLLGRIFSRRFWTGYCSSDADESKLDAYYLADNLTWLDNERRDVLLTPCYRWLPGKLGAILDYSTTLNCLGWSAARVATTVKRLRAGGFEEIATINDDGISPEVCLSFSKGDIFDHVHLSLYNVHTKATANHVFKIDASVDFDGHVTHAEHCGDGVVVCVNFLKKSLMIIEAKELVTALPTPPAVAAKIEKRIADAKRKAAGKVFVSSVNAATAVEQVDLSA